MIKFVVLLAVIGLSVSIPYDDQMTLASSLIVGRADYSDLYNWECKVCDASNKPVHAHIIEEKAKDVKCIITVYPKFIILAFRYTNTALNVWQDILYPIQVAFLKNFRSRINTPVISARSKRLTTTCGRQSRTMSLET
jgi:hypothetical protein